MVRVFAGAAVAVAAAGCAAPPAGPTTQPAGAAPTVSGWETDLGVQTPAMEWLPIAGRAGREVQVRHGLDTGRETVVLEEGFDQFSGSYVPGWQIVGYPSLRRVELDGEAGIEIRRPADAKEACGIERELAAADLAGRDVRVEVRLTCRSFVRLEALEGVRILLIASDEAGRSSELDLPLEVGVSPGWEWMRFWLRLRPEVRGVKLRLMAAGAGSLLAVDAIRMTAWDPLAGSRTVDAASNLIADGDFETGAARFYAHAASVWPGGEERRWPLAWQMGNDPSAGGNALTVYLAAPVGRVGFGPVDLNPAASGQAGDRQRVFAGFMARASRPARLTVLLRAAGRELGRLTYELTPQWQRFTGSFQIAVAAANQRLELARGELVFAFTGDGLSEAMVCGLDAVTLQGRPTVSRYVPSGPVEIGLTAGQAESTDLVNLFDLQEPVALGVRLSGEPSVVPITQPAAAAAEARPAGRLAIDLLDAWDRVVARQTREVSLPASGVYGEWASVGVLPRGYYRALATLWAGEPGRSRLIARTSLPLAVVSLRDPVPAQSFLGLSAPDGLVSMRTTQLGASWVRMDVSSRRLQTSANSVEPSGPGQWDYAAWQMILGQCQRAQVDVMADVDLPLGAQARRSFLESWLGEETFEPLGIVVRPPAIGRMSGRDYLLQLEQVRQVLAGRWPGLRVVEDLSYLDGLPDGATPADGQPVPIVWGLSGRDLRLPEKREGYLEAIGRRRPANCEVWELNAPVRLGAVPPIDERVVLRSTDSGAAAGGPGLVEMLESPVDPVRSASRLVRAAVIRTLAGANMVCSEAVALAAVGSIDDDDRLWLFERTYGPRAGLVAFDLAAELLNSASPGRWIDLPGGGRVVYFEKDDGRAVAALWRPFGLAATRVSFAALPATTQAIDCVGLPVALAAADGRQVLEVNEIVRYLIVPADQRETLRQALDTIQVDAGASGPPEEPPASGPSTRAVR